MHVLVVGAGPTGLTAALELRRHGVDVTVIERREGPSPLSRAVGITAGSMDILRPCGVAEAIDADAVRFSGIRMHDEQTRLILSAPLNFDERSRIWGLAQDRTEAHLAEGLHRHGGSVRYGTPLKAFAEDADGVTARYGGEDHRHDWMIAADGRHSMIREKLGILYEGKDLPDTWSIADVFADDWPFPDTFQGFLRPDQKVCVVVPLEAARFRVISSADDALAALPVPMKVREVRRSGTFGISVRLAASYRQGRVLLAGDAAHCHSPVGGRGMNLGIADAAEAAARIAGDTVDGYSGSRHAEGARVIALTERARQLMLAPPGLRRSMFRAALSVVNAVPPLGRAAMRRFSGD